MADELDDRDQNVEESGSEDEGKQTFTREDVEALINDKVEAVRKEYAGIQSGLQRKLNEAEQALKATEDKGKSLEQKTAEELAELKAELAERDRRTQRAELRSVATEMLAAEGIKTKLIDRLVGDDVDSTKQLVSDFVQERKEQLASERQQWDAKHGIKPRSADNQSGGKLSDEEVDAMIRNPDGTVNLAAYEKIRDQL